MVQQRGPQKSGLFFVKNAGVWRTIRLMTVKFIYLDQQYTFGEALALLKDGKRVARLGWNGKGMFLFLVNGSHFKVNRPPLLGIYPEGTEISYRPHIDMRTANGEIVPWVASQSDLIEEDWVLHE